MSSTAAFANVFKVPDLRKKITVTLGLLFIYRIGDGTVVAVPVFFKPQDIEVQHTYRFADLLEVMRARLHGHYQPGDRLLFETGDESWRFKNREKR